MFAQYVQLTEQKKEPLSKMIRACAGILAIRAEAKLDRNKDLDSLLQIIDDSLAPKNSRAIWAAYREYITRSAAKTPDPHLYLPLPEIAGYLFQVRIENGTFRFQPANS